MVADDGLHSSVGFAHVDVVVAVIPHKAERVLPVACVGVVGIVDNLVHHNLALGLVTCRQTAHTHIGTVALG